MTPTIFERCQPDGVAEFRAAATARFEDARRLSEGPPRMWLGAVYLWGYSVEMVLKPAVFDLLGNAAAQPISNNDLKAAQQLAQAVSLVWSGNLHNLALWAKLLVRFRGRLPGRGYPDQRRASEVVARAARVYGWWREGLRYHVVAVTPAELAEASEQAEWFVRNAPTL